MMIEEAGMTLINALVSLNEVSGTCLPEFLVALSPDLTLNAQPRARTLQGD